VLLLLGRRGLFLCLSTILVRLVFAIVVVGLGLGFVVVVGGFVLWRLCIAM